MRAMGNLRALPAVLGRLARLAAAEGDLGTAAGRLSGVPALWQQVGDRARCCAASGVREPAGRRAAGAGTAPICRCRYIAAAAWGTVSAAAAERGRPRSGRAAAADGQIPATAARAAGRGIALQTAVGFAAVRLGRTGGHTERPVARRALSHAAQPARVRGGRSCRCRADQPGDRRHAGDRQADRRHARDPILDSGGGYARSDRRLGGAAGTGSPCRRGQ